MTAKSSVKASSPRYPYVDLLRGWFIFVIVVDHLQRWPSAYEFITGKGALWVSAAEGFFIVSGMMVGMIRGREWLTGGWKSATKKLWLRAVQLYVLAISLTWLYTWLAIQFGNGPGVKDGAMVNQSIGTIFLQTLTGQYVYGWSDFLIYYAVFLLLSPLALWALSRGWWLAVGVISMLAFAFGLGHFGLMWQPFFFGGLMFGFFFPRLQAWWRALTEKGRQLVMIGIFSVTLATLILSVGFVHLRIDNSWYDHTLGNWFERYYWIGAGRVILAPFWFLSIFFIFKRFQNVINNRLGWLLLPFGQNALTAYTFQGLVVFLLNFILPKDGNLLVNFGLVSLVLFVIWYAVKTLHPFLAAIHYRLQTLVV